MADVVAFANGLAEALAHAGLSRDGRRDLTPLAVTPAAPTLLADALVETLREPHDGVLVIDDYHFALGVPETEALLANLTRRCALRVLLASRIRPRWLDARMQIYGESLLVGVEDLAFTEDEARRVLDLKEARAVDAIVDRAKGWPAVIGLAARRDAPPPSDAQTALPGELFNYLADDLFVDATPELRRTLFLAALVGDVDSDVLRSLVGPDLPSQVRVACERGLFVRVTNGRTELHPLIREFLISKIRDLQREERDAIVCEAIDSLVDARKWDDCLRALDAFPLTKLIDGALAAALSDLLEAGRVLTVRRWTDLARRSGSESPVLLVADADVALRERCEQRALTIGEQAGILLGDGELAAHAYLVAARAAHLLGEADSARRNFLRARLLTSSPKTRAATLWIEFLRGIEANDEGAARSVLKVFAELDDQSATHAVRVGHARAFLEFQLGGRIREAEHALQLPIELLPHTHDPMLRTNVRNLSAILALYSAQYERAVELADGLVRDAEECGVQFAADHGLLTRVSALIGLRELAAAERTLRKLEATASSTSTFVQGHITLRRAQMSVAIGDLATGELLLRGEPPTLLPLSFVAEWTGTHAVILGAMGHPVRARQAIRRCLSVGPCVDGRNLSTLAGVVVALRNGAAPSDTRALHALIRDGNRDPVVLAWRADPGVAKFLGQVPELRDTTLELLVASRDNDVGRAAGIIIPRRRARGGVLSPRERDVYELIVQGRTNREIAQTLFISESTTKVHVRHIFEKLGVRSRAQAAARAVE